MKSALGPLKIYTKHKWEKCDDIAYKSSVSEEIKTSQKSQTSPVESRIKKLETSMNKAGAKSIPYYRKLKTLKTTGKGIWNKKISLAVKEAKSAHRKWKDKKNIYLNADLDKQDLKKQKKEFTSITKTGFQERAMYRRNHGSILER